MRDVVFVVLATTLCVLLVDASPDAQDYCPVLEDVCRCGLNLQEFVCREAGFTGVPQVLPTTVTKL